MTEGTTQDVAVQTPAAPAPTPEVQPAPAVSTAPTVDDVARMMGDNGFDLVMPKTPDMGTPSEPAKPEPEAKPDVPAEATAASGELISMCPDSFDQVRFRELLHVANRDGMSEKAIKSFLADPQEFIQYAEKREKNQKDIDRLLREKGKDPSQDDAIDTTQTPKESDTAPPVANLKELVLPLAEKLDLDEEGQKVLNDTFSAVLGPVQSALTQATEQSAKQIAILSQQIGTLMIQNSRTSLMGEYPGLADDETWNSVATSMDKLSKSNVPYANVDALTRDAIRMSGLEDQINQQGHTKAQHIRNAQANGMPPTDTSKPQTGGTMSRTDMELKLIEASMSNDNVGKRHWRDQIAKHSSG